MRTIVVISVLFYSCSLFGATVKIKAQKLSMSELLVEAARQVGKIVLFEQEDPKPNVIFYDCEVNFDDVVSAYIGYYQNHYGVVLSRIDNENIVILKVSKENEAMPNLEKHSVAEMIPAEVVPNEISPKSSTTKGWLRRIFTGKSKSDVEADESVAAPIKALHYGDTEAIGEAATDLPKPNHDQNWNVPSKMKVEVLSSKPSRSKYFHSNEEMASDLDVIELNPIESNPANNNLDLKKLEPPKVEISLQEPAIVGKNESKQLQETEKKLGSAPLFPDL